LFLINRGKAITRSANLLIAIPLNHFFNKLKQIPPPQDFTRTPMKKQQKQDGRNPKGAEGDRRGMPGNQEQFPQDDKRQRMHPQQEQYQ